MRHSIAILFFLVLGCSVSTINFTDPAHAVVAGGTNDDKGGPGGGVQKPLVITNTNLTSKDMENIAQAFKDGKKYVTLTDVSGKTYHLFKSTWDTFVPYDPKFIKKNYSLLNVTNFNDATSVKRYLRFLKKSLRKLDTKLKLAKKVGTPAQVEIIRKMVSLIANAIVNTESKIKGLEGK